MKEMPNELDTQVESSSFFIDHKLSYVPPSPFTLGWMNDPASNTSPPRILGDGHSSETV